jgi:MFS family permease
VTTRKVLWPLVTALWVAELTGSFETAMILAALKALVADFGDPAKVGWLVTGYLIVGAAVAAIVGRLGDLHGRRRVLCIVLAIGATGSLISALSTSFAMLLAGRIIQGATGAILPLCIGLVRENVSAERTPVTIGLMLSGAALGTAVGLVLGGVIVDHWSWHGVFFASAAFCTTALAGVAVLVPRSPRAPASGPTDWLSGLLFAPGVVLVLLWVTLGPRWGWLDPRALAMLGAGVALVVWWWGHSLRSPEPLISVRAFADRTVAVGSAVTALVAMSTLQITVFFSLLLQAPKWTAAGLGLSATAAGLAKLPSNIFSIEHILDVRRSSGWMARRARRGAAGDDRRGPDHHDRLGAGAAQREQRDDHRCRTDRHFVRCDDAVRGRAHDHRPGLAARVSEIAGLVTVIRQLFLGIGSQLVATLLAVDTVTRGAERFPSPYAYRITVIAIIAVSLIATAVCLALPASQLSQSREKIEP